MGSLRNKLTQAGHVFLEEIGKDDYESIQTMLNTAKSMRYDSNTTYLEFIKECDSQCIITDEEWMMKGKFDHYNPTRKIIADLKTTGKFDTLIKELQFK